MASREDKKLQTRQALLDAALRLSFTKGSFANISLREIAQAVEIVPTAFYRHYAELNALGLDLADHVAIYIRNTFYQLGKEALENPYNIPENSLDALFKSVDEHPEQWHFFLAERLSGNLILRHAIQREHHFLLQEFTQRIIDVPSLEKFCQTGLAPSLASLYLQSAFHWTIQWIELKNQYEGEVLRDKQARLRHSALKQIHFLYLGFTAKKPTEVSF